MPQFRFMGHIRLYLIELTERKLTSFHSVGRLVLVFLVNVSRVPVLRLNNSKENSSFSWASTKKATYPHIVIFYEKPCSFRVKIVFVWFSDPFVKSTSSIDPWYQLISYIHTFALIFIYYHLHILSNSKLCAYLFPNPYDYWRIIQSCSVHFYLIKVMDNTATHRNSSRSFPVPFYISTKLSATILPTMN